jgi:hypothetical protein
VFFLLSFSGNIIKTDPDLQQKRQKGKTTFDPALLQIAPVLPSTWNVFEADQVEYASVSTRRLERGTIGTKTNYLLHFRNNVPFTFIKLSFMVSPK